MNVWQDTTDANDLRTFCEQWLSLGAWCGDMAPPPDGDDIVDWLDVAVFADNWLTGIE